MAIKGVVITGDIGQYRHWIETTKSNPNEYKYAHLREHILGLHKTKVIYTGEYWKNPLYMTTELDIIQGE